MPATVSWRHGCWLLEVTSALASLYKHWRIWRSRDRGGYLPTLSSVENEGKYGQFWRLCSCCLDYLRADRAEKACIDPMGERRSRDRNAWAGGKRHLVWGGCLYSRTLALLTFAHFLIYFSAFFPWICFRSLQSFRPWLEVDASPLALCLILMASAQQCPTAELCPHYWSPPSSRTPSFGEQDDREDGAWGEGHGGTGACRLSFLPLAWATLF